MNWTSSIKKETENNGLVMFNHWLLWELMLQTKNIGWCLYKPYISRSDTVNVFHEKQNPKHCEYVCLCVSLCFGLLCFTPNTREHPQKPPPRDASEAPVLLQFDATDELSHMLKRWVFFHTSPAIPKTSRHVFPPKQKPMKFGSTQIMKNCPNALLGGSKNGNVWVYCEGFPL